MYKVYINMPKEYRQMLDKVLKQLEKNNVAYTGNKKFITYFAMKTKEPKRHGHLIFSWSKQWHKSVVTLAPDIKLEKTKFGFNILESGA